MSDNLPPLPDLNRLAPFVEGLGKAILSEMIEDLSAIAADRVSREVPAEPAKADHRKLQLQGLILASLRLGLAQPSESLMHQLDRLIDFYEGDKFADALRLLRHSVRNQKHAGRSIPLVPSESASPQPQPVQAQPSEPIDMVLHCPACGEQHIDAPDEVPGQPILKSASTTEHPHKMMQVGTYTAQGEWTNPPHRSHLCHGCGHIWRPADVPTNGVSAAKTKGKADSPVAQPKPANQQKD